MASSSIWLPTISVADTKLRADLLASSGSSIVGFKRSVLTTPIDNVEEMLDTQAISPWEFAALIVTKPTADPATWDWTPAFIAMFAAQTTYKVKVISLGGWTYRLFNGLSPYNYEWTNTVFISSGATIIVDTPINDNVGLQIGSNVVIIGHLIGSVINGISNGNGFVRTAICVGRWWDSIEVKNVHLQSLYMTGLVDNTAMAIAGNVHGIQIGRLEMNTGLLGLMIHWSGLPNNISPTSTYHPHDIHIGSLVGSGFTDALVTESACYDIRIDYINGQNNFRDVNHLGGDFGDQFAVARDINKVCKGNSIGRIESVGATGRCVNFNASAGLIVKIMAGDFSIDSVKAIGTNAASSVGLRFENRDSGRIGFADISNFANNIIQINCNGGNDGELRSSLATQQGILFSTAQHIHVDILRTTNDNQAAAGGVSGVQCAGTSKDIDIGLIRVATNNTATHGCVLNNSVSDIRIRKVNGAVDPSRSLLVDNAAPNVNKIGPCILDTGVQSYNGPDSYASATSRGNIFGFGSALPTSGSFLRGDAIFNTLAAASASPGWVCVTSGIAGSTAVFKTMPNLSA